METSPIQKSRPAWQVVLAFVAVYLLWGGTFVAMRANAHALHPGFISGLRYFVAGILMLVFLKLRGEGLGMSASEWRMAALIGLMMFTGNNLLVTASERSLTAGLAALIVSSIPLFIAVLEALLPGGSSMGMMGWIGTMGGLVGLVLLTWNSLRGGNSSAETGLACGMLLFASAVWAAGSILTRHARLRVNPLLFATWQMVIAGTVNIGIGFAAGGWETAHWTRSVLTSESYLVFCGSLAGYMSYQFLLRNVKLSAAATYAYVNPIVAVLLSWWLLRETLHGIEWVGMTVILASVALVIASKPKVRSELVPEGE